MTLVKPVEVPVGAFAFCRWSLALLLWAAFLLRQPWMVGACAVVLAVSAALGVGRAPMIVLWKATAHRLLPTRDVVLDERAMRFAHGLGTLLCTAALALLLASPGAGRALLAVIVVAKTVSAVGICPAAKIYACLTSGGGCCGVVRGRDV